jgi:phage/plasmid-associated DNA primase
MNTETTALEMKQIATTPLIDYLDSNKIPYIFIHIDKVKKLEPKKVDKIATDWMQKSYDELCGKGVKFEYITKKGEKKMYSYDQRKKHKQYYNGLNINLHKSGLVIADIDDADTTEKWLSEFGKKWITYSTRKKLPHLWFNRDEGDKGTTKTKCRDGLDLLYQNVFEHRDSVIEYTDEPMKTFTDFAKYEPAPKPKPTKAKAEGSLNELIDSWKTPASVPEDMSPEQYEILENISIDYCENYGDWLRIIWALNNTFGSLKICCDWSAKSGKYKGEDDIKKYLQNDTRKVLTFGTICYYSKLSDPTAYYAIKSKYFNWGCFSDMSLAQLYIETIGDEAIYDANSGLYLYKKPFWVPIRDREKGKLKLSIYRVLYSLTQSEKERISKKITELTFSEGASAEVKSYWAGQQKVVLKLQESLGSNTRLNNIKLIVLPLISENERIYNIDDLNPFLFSFKNKTFNIRENSLTEYEISKYDYISMHTGYDWAEPSYEQMQMIDKLFREIMPEDDKRKGLLSAFKSALTGEQTPYFYMFTGTGSNGKGTLLELLKYALGMYFCCSNVDFLTTSIKSGANTTLYSYDKMRAIQYSEPEENVELLGSSIKAITDNPEVKGRGLYMEKEVDIIFHNATFMDCNSLPNIRGRKDYAVLRRILVWAFNSTFVDSAEDVADAIDHGIKGVFLKNSQFKNTEFKLGHRCAMIKYIIMNGQYPLYKPACVEAYAKKYLLNTDDLYNWFADNYNCTKKKEDYITMKDIYSCFKQSEFYRNLSGSEKSSKWGKRSFTENIQSNIELKKYCNTAPKTSIGNTSIGQHVWGWVPKQTEEIII